VIALAAAHAGSAPVNARLLVLIREAEKQRVHFTGEQLLAILRDTASGERPYEPERRRRAQGPQAPK
jgi:hypothetical protein